MPTIIDNVEVRLLDQLSAFIGSAYQVKACIGFLNLKGWRALGGLIESLVPYPQDPPCKVLIGIVDIERGIDPALAAGHRTDGEQARHYRKTMLELLCQQITRGIPTESAQSALRMLSAQLRSGTVQIKLHTRYPLHAKLYLIKRPDHITPRIGFVGSSNLTYAGLYEQGELNVDVVEQDAAEKLDHWFDQRWNDPFSLDISLDLADIIDQSWAGEPIEKIEHLPYLIYLKVAYHLSENARLGQREFEIPPDLRRILLDFQIAAVQLAAKLVKHNGGVILADVVGLGKTLMATAVARVLHEHTSSSTLVICPPKLQQMWDEHLDRYLRHPASAHARTLSIGQVERELGSLRRFHTLIIDESHNLTNPESKRYRAIAEYIEENDPQVILLSATPYNKSYRDLASQLRLFLDPKKPLPASPVRWITARCRELGIDEAMLQAQYQAPLNSLDCFQESTYPDDWRDLMRHFMVRRTRSFIINTYAHFDQQKQRYYVHRNGTPHYFPARQPRTVKVPLSNTPYDALYSDPIVERIGQLELARYGLALYLDRSALTNAPKEYQTIAANLTRAGKRLIGFARTNLFKRLESSGWAFLLSIRRHLLHNHLLLYALENNKSLPIGDSGSTALRITALLDSDEEDQFLHLRSSSDQDIAALYDTLSNTDKDKYDWMPANYFVPRLADSLREDNAIFEYILKTAGKWNPNEDPKLTELFRLVADKHPNDKLLIFSQFADTATYIENYLRTRGILSIALVTSSTNNPSTIIRRFSPHSNGGIPPGETELRVLVTTDTLSEGQNLQDCHIIVNFDLPWGIVRLIQRAGRVDRIGQRADTITVYSFLPAEGIERIIALHERLRTRLRENQETIGTDEVFFDEDTSRDILGNLYTEHAHVLEQDDDRDVDITSYALEVWEKAPAADRERARALPDQVYATRPNDTSGPDGAIVFARIQRGDEHTDHLIRVRTDGTLVEQSLGSLFDALACPKNTPQLPSTGVLALLPSVVERIERDAIGTDGALGPPRSTRRRLYQRLRAIEQHAPTDQIRMAASSYAALIYANPLTDEAESVIRRALRTDTTDTDLLGRLSELHEASRLISVSSTGATHVQILCSMGLLTQQEP